MQLGERAGRRASLGSPSDGFTYVALLALVAVSGVAMAVIGPAWARQTQRDREDRLLRVACAYADAIESYKRRSPGASPAGPDSVDALLEDRRFQPPIRHLREAYSDPMRPGQPLQVLKGQDGHLLGVASGSDAEPLRRVSWTDGRHVVLPASRYSDWHVGAVAEVHQ